jgi:hypothetical protein
MLVYFATFLKPFQLLSLVIHFIISLQNLDQVPHKNPVNLPSRYGFLYEYQGRFGLLPTHSHRQSFVHWEVRSRGNRTQDLIQAGFHSLLASCRKIVMLPTRHGDAFIGGGTVSGRDML